MVPTTWILQQCDHWLSSTGFGSLCIRVGWCICGPFPKLRWLLSVLFHQFPAPSWLYSSVANNKVAICLGKYPCFYRKIRCAGIKIIHLDVIILPVKIGLWLSSSSPLQLLSIPSQISTAAGLIEALLSFAIVVIVYISVGAGQNQQRTVVVRITKSVIVCVAVVGRYRRRWTSVTGHHATCFDEIGRCADECKSYQAAIATIAGRHRLP